MDNWRFAVYICFLNQGKDKTFVAAGGGNSFPPELVYGCASFSVLYFGTTTYLLTKTKKQIYTRMQSRMTAIKPLVLPLTSPIRERS